MKKLNQIFKMGGLRERFACLAVVCFLFATGRAFSLLTTYDWPTGPGEAVLSDKYQVWVKSGDEQEQPLEVIMSDAIYDGDYRSSYLKGRTFSFATVSYNAEAGEGLTFRIAKVFGSASASAEIAPKLYGLAHTLSGDGREVTFSIDANNKYISINFKGTDNEVRVTSNKTWIKHMLCIFIDPPETDMPDLNDPTVVKYGKDVDEAVLRAAQTVVFEGYHNLKEYSHPGSYIDKWGMLKSGVQDLYFSGGSFVECLIETGSNAKIYGRGIISGRKHIWHNSSNWDGYRVHEIIDIDHNCTVQGIHYIEPSNHGIVGGSDNLVENVKFLGWHCNNDGVRVGSGSVIRNSFFRSVDDDFYNFDIHVHDCVLWKGHNGSIMTFGWGGEQGSNTYNAGGSLMENVVVIHPEWTGLGNNNGLIMAQTGLDFRPHDYGTGATTVFRNITIEGSIPGLLNLKPRSSSGNPVAVKVPYNSVGYLGNVILENIRLEGQFDKNRMKGVTDAATTGNATYWVQDVHLNHVRIAGETLGKANAGKYFEINEAVRFIRFDNLQIEGHEIENAANAFVGSGSHPGIHSWPFFSLPDPVEVPVAGEAPIGRFISLKSLSADKYVHMDAALPASCGPICANSDTAAPEFEIYDAGDGLIALRASNGYFVKADLPRYGYLHTLPDPNRGDSDTRRITEDAKFVWVDLGEGQAALYAQSTGLYVRAEANSGPANPLYAASGDIGDAETFDWVPGDIWVNEFPVSDPWQSLDIGFPAIRGIAQYKNNQFIIQAGCENIFGTMDEFHYVFTPAVGDVDILCRIDTGDFPSNYSLAGVMIREKLTESAKHASALAQANREISFRKRKTEGGSTLRKRDIVEGGITYPQWLRVIRTGNRFEMYSSSDGQAWVRGDSMDIEMAHDVFVGLAVSSYEGNKVTTATFSNVLINGETVSVREMSSLVSEACVLYANYPNPFNPSTAIHYHLPAFSRVHVQVFDTSGRLVSVLVDAEQTAGLHQVRFDGSGLASGVYFCRIQATTGGHGFTDVLKMMLMK